MRVALISLAERSGDNSALPLAALSLAGRSIAERQLDLALALGCERIVCITQGLDGGLIAMQHSAERAGAIFNLVSGARPLSGLVHANDELVVFAPGLLPLAQEAREILQKGQGVLVLPVDSGLEAGFERIDLNHAWAGVLIMPGRMVEQLTQLPPDCDCVSALLRIALQGRVTEKMLPENVLERRDWVRISTGEELDELEPDWFRQHVAPATPYSPGRTLARMAMRFSGPSLLERGWRPGFLSGIGVFLAVLGLVSAYFEYELIGLFLCGLAWLLVESSCALRSIAKAGFASDHGPPRFELAVERAIDVSFILVIAFALPGGWAVRLFPAVMLVGLAHLTGRLIPQAWSELAQDRFILALLLILAGATGQLLPVIHVMAVILLLILISLARATARLTQT